MLKQEKKKINGHTYNVTQFTASEGFLIRTKLKDINDWDVLEILKLMSKTIRDDEAINESTFDKFFTDNYDELEEAMAFVASFNFLPKKGTGNLLERPVQK